MITQRPCEYAHPTQNGLFGSKHSAIGFISPLTLQILEACQYGRQRNFVEPVNLTWQPSQ